MKKNRLFSIFYIWIFILLVFHLIHDIHLSPHLSFTSSSFSDTSSLSFILFSPLFCPPYILPPFLPLFHPFLPPLPSISSSSPLFFSLPFLSTLYLLPFSSAHPRSQGQFPRSVVYRWEFCGTSIHPSWWRTHTIQWQNSRGTVFVLYRTVLYNTVLRVKERWFFYW